MTMKMNKVKVKPLTDDELDKLITEEMVNEVFDRIYEVKDESE